MSCHSLRRGFARQLLTTGGRGAAWNGNRVNSVQRQWNMVKTTFALQDVHRHCCFATQGSQCDCSSCSHIKKTGTRSLLRHYSTAHKANWKCAESTIRNPSITRLLTNKYNKYARVVPSASSLSWPTAISSWQLTEWLTSFSHAVIH